MTAPGQLLLLGTGTSHGVPMIGCQCAVCRSSDPKNRRTRCSAYLSWGEVRLLLDTSIDLRQQALTHNLSRVDAVLYTHGHVDHLFGLDELRMFNLISGHPMPIYADAATLQIIRRVFEYVFAPAPPGGGIPQVEVHELAGSFALGGLPVTLIPVWHGPKLILGYRFGDLAYLTDCSGIPEESWELLHGVRFLVLDALRHRSHPTHFNLEQAVATAQRLGAEHTYFVHMCHDLDHEAVNAQLPSTIQLAYDGQVIEFNA